MKYPGYEIKVLINGAHYATNGVDIDETAQGQNVTDSEGIPGCSGGVGGFIFTITGGTNAAPCVLTLSVTPSPALVVGMQVTLTGTTGATTFAGVHTITAVATNTITLDNAVAPGGAITAGSVTVGGVVQVGAQAKVPGTTTATIVIKKPTWDDQQNAYFLTPFKFETQTYDRVQIYPQGVGASEPLWDFYSALTVRLSLNNDVNALEPLSITYESDGGYLTPSGFA